MKRCIWCAEDPGPNLDHCASCGRSQTAEDGTRLRKIDLLYDSAVQRQTTAYHNLMRSGVAGFALVSVGAPALAVAAPLVAAILLTTHMILLRLYLLRGSFPLLSGKRRFFVRWITRLGLILAGTFGYSTTVAPVVGAVTGAVTFAALTAATNAYVFRSLKRERMKLPLEAWEKIVLILLAITVVAVLVIAVTLGALVGWGVAELQDVFR